MSALVATPRDRTLALALRACAGLAVLLGAGVIAASARLGARVAGVEGGALPALGPLLGYTAGVAVATTALATPLCVGAATWRARMVPRGRRLDAGGLALDALSVMPPVVFGAAAALALRAQAGVAGALAAGAAVMATVRLGSFVALCEEAVRAVPRELEDVSLALGATPWFTLRRVTWPAAARGIFAAALRATARVVGECAALVLALGAGGAQSVTAAVALGAMAVALTLAGRWVNPAP